MWRLRTSGGRFLAIASLPATLGSEAGNDLRLRHASVQAHHARFAEAPDGRLAVEALDEAVVGVGGKRVRHATLGDGEELILGRLRFTLERVGEAGGQAAAAAEPTLEARGATARRQAGRARPARAGAGGRRAAAATGPSSGDEVISLRDKTLRFSKQPERRGMLNVDFAQLSTGWKALIILALLAVGAGLLWGVSLLTGVFG